MLLAAPDKVQIEVSEHADADANKATLQLLSKVRENVNTLLSPLCSRLSCCQYAGCEASFSAFANEE
jgi:hypothetical protein